MKILLSVFLSFSLLASSHAQKEAQLAKILERFPEADADKDGTLTEAEAVAFREKMKSPGEDRRNKRAKAPRIEPTHENVSYGDHERHVFDVWIPETETKNEEAAEILPFPVLVFFHGGGFVGGNKTGFDPKMYLDAGIACVSANYRFVDGGDTLSPIPMEDGARVIQTLRHKALDWNLDGGRIALSGSSAGAVIAMWIGYHDDLAEPDAEDPVARESTRVTCVVPINGPTNLMPDWIVKNIGGSDHVHGSFPKMFGADADGEGGLNVETIARIQSSSPWEFVSDDDPPTLLIYNGSLEELPLPADTSTGRIIHHPFFGKSLKERLDELEVECDFRHTFDPRGNPTIVDYLRTKFAMVE